MDANTGLRISAAKRDTLLVGGCHGSCCLHVSEGTGDDSGRDARRQFVLGNLLVLTLSLAIVALAAAVF